MFARLDEQKALPYGRRSAVNAGSAPMQHPKTRWSNTTIAILGAIACATIFALTIGLTFPLLSFVLQTQGYSDAAIGFSAAMTPLGVLVASPVYPRIIRRFGDWQVVAVCLVATGLVILMMGLWANFAVFLLLRFLLGVFDSGVFIISETWINQLASTRSRGRIVGLYATSLSTGFGLGPLILAWTGSESFLPFAIGSACCALALVVVLAVRRASPGMHRKQASSSFSFLRLAPTLLVAIAVFAFWDAAVLALFPIYGMSFGMTASFASLALAVCILGNTLLQFPIGWLADLTSRRAVLILCCCVAVGGALLLPVISDAKAVLLPVLFVWGAAAGGVYTMAMTELGDRFSGSDLVAGNAAFAVAYGVGGLVGGPSIGGAMHAFGPSGFSGSLAIVFGATAVFAFWRCHRAR